MPRRTVLTIKEIHRRRANSWEWHYQNRTTVRQLTSIDIARVATVICREVPPPIMRIDGSLTEGMATLKGRQRAIEALNLLHTHSYLMCAWYWSQSGWDDYVEQFQSLPEIYEDHYLLYDTDADAALIVPLSQREPNSNKGTKKVQKGATAPLVPFRDQKPHNSNLQSADVPFET